LADYPVIQIRGDAAVESKQTDAQVIGLDVRSNFWGCWDDSERCPGPEDKEWPVTADAVEQPTDALPFRRHEGRPTCETPGSRIVTNTGVQAISEFRTVAPA
jgi:hypothetical protein